MAIKSDSNPVFPTIYPVACHTDNIGSNSIFIAIEGMREHGSRYIRDAIEKGAIKVVIGREAILPADIEMLCKERSVAITRVDNPRQELAVLSATAAGYPATKLKIIGVTGTKGKTSTSFILYQLLHRLGVKVALLSSAGHRIQSCVYETSLTTPHPDYIHQFLATCVNEGIEWVILESAAQAFSLSRLHGIMFDAAVFTNFAPAHGEFYGTADQYRDAKCQIFNHLKAGAPIIYNRDDEIVKQAVTTMAKAVRPVGVSMYDTASSDVVIAGDPGLASVGGTLLRNGTRRTFEVPALIGDFNLYNIAAAYAVLTALGYADDDVIVMLSAIEGIPGRMTMVPLANKALGVIDKAHTPESYQAVLGALRPRTEKLIVIFGAGGDRDPSVRPELARIAADYADALFITDDNPRYEDPEKIIRDVSAGISQSAWAKTVICRDRTKAIHDAYALATDGTIIAILGKGSEEYELVRGVKHPLSERTILESL